MAYIEGGVDAESRLRLLIADTADAIHANRIARWLEDSLGVETFRIYLPTDTDGATGATVEVVMDGTDLKLVLQRTTSPAEAASSLVLAPGKLAPKLRDVIDWIGGLAKGWQVGCSIGDDLDWCDPSSTSWLNSLVTVGSMALYAPSINLAVTDAALEAYGDEDDAAELRFYQIGRAAQIGVMTQDVGTVSNRREGNVARTYRGVVDALGAHISRLAGEGIYAV